MSLDGGLSLVGAFFVSACIVMIHVVSVSGTAENVVDPIFHCQELLAALTAEVSGYDSCVLNETKPNQMCLSCLHHFQRVQEAYKNMTVRFHVSNDNEATREESCADRYARNNIVDPFDTMIELTIGSKSLWKRSHCNDCYEDNDSSKGVLKNTTLMLSRYYEETIKCFNEQFPNRDDKFSWVLNKKDCDRCASSFAKTFAFFTEEIRQKAIDVQQKYTPTICMDVLNMVNVTTKIWTDQLGCHKRWTSPKLLVLIPLTFLFLYVGFLFHQPIFHRIFGLQYPQTDNMVVYYNRVPQGVNLSAVRSRGQQATVSASSL